MRLKKNNLNYFFHPYEIAICGFSNTGKTTLISKVVQELSKKHITGYLKHDAHKFSIDHPGKDTAVIRSAGATDTLINDKNRHAYISDKELDQVDTANFVKDNDILIIEGHKYSKIPKIIFLGEGKTKEDTLAEIASGKITNIVALIISNEQDINPLPQYPVFSRNSISALVSFINEYFQALIPKKMFGLVLSGGKSQRMNKDKGGLKYFDKDQVSHTLDLITPFCDEVFVSCREDQSFDEFVGKHNKIIDSFPSVGPSSGILSAMHKHPDAAWLIIACDLPYLKSKTIEHLILKRNPYKNATCYLNPTRGWPEPLCTIYEPKIFNKLIQYFGLGKPCPRKVLFNSEINALELNNKLDLNNVNTPAEFDLAINHIEEHKDLYEN
jgi:molybdenum cofactor guanylyltransferase